MSDVPEIPAESPQEAAGAAEANHREPAVTADELPGEIARKVTLTWRAIEEVNMRLSAVELELTVLTSLTLIMLVAFVLESRSKP
jgi:hypothetical protein